MIEETVAPQQGCEPGDDEIEAIHEAAQAAVHGWGLSGVAGRGNPYPSGSARAEIYDYAYRNAHAQANGY